MQFILRKVSDFADCVISDGNTSISFGFIDNKEARQLLEAFKDAVNDLEWFVNATDKDDQ